MRIYEENGNIIVEQVSDFNVAQTLNCGQCFHFREIGDNEFGVVAYGKLLHISQDDDRVIFHNTDMEAFEKVWRGYFDLDTDYAKIKKKLGKSGSELDIAMKEMWGVRILRQEFFETLMSFIISQNKQIPHIKQIVWAISEKYGDFLGNLKGVDFYSFPSVEKLAGVTEDDFKLLKTGFRAPYLANAVECISNKIVDESVLRTLTGEECIESLCQIKGVGRKVGSCVTLFSLSKMECFPIDVWIQRIMEHMYFHRTASKQEIEKLASERFGLLGGYAQQYLFYYGREIKMGIDKTK